MEIFFELLLNNIIFLKILVWRLYTRWSPVQTRVFYSENMNSSFITGGTQKGGIVAEGNATKQNLVLCIFNESIYHHIMNNLQIINQWFLTPVECTEHLHG